MLTPRRPRRRRSATPLDLARWLSVPFITVAAAATSLPWQNALILGGFILIIYVVSDHLHRRK